MRPPCEYPVKTTAEPEVIPASAIACCAARYDPALGPRDGADVARHVPGVRARGEREVRGAGQVHLEPVGLPGRRDPIDAHLACRRSGCGPPGPEAARRAAGAHPCGSAAPQRGSPASTPNGEASPATVAADVSRPRMPSPSSPSRCAAATGTCSAPPPKSSVLMTVRRTSSTTRGSLSTARCASAQPDRPRNKERRRAAGIGGKRQREPAAGDGRGRERQQGKHRQKKSQVVAEQCGQGLRHPGGEALRERVPAGRLRQRPRQVITGSLAPGQARSRHRRSLAPPRRRSAERPPRAAPSR